MLGRFLPKLQGTEYHAEYITAQLMGKYKGAPVTESAIRNDHPKTELPILGASDRCVQQS